MYTVIIWVGRWVYSDDLLFESKEEAQEVASRFGKEATALVTTVDLARKLGLTSD